MIIFVVHNNINNMYFLKLKIRLQHGWDHGKPPTYLPTGNVVVQTVAASVNHFDRCTTTKKRLTAEY